MKVALAHDSLVQLGGAERVLQALHQIYPDAPVFTLVYDKKLAEHFENWTIVSSPLQHIYHWTGKRFKWLLPFIPFAVKFFDFSDFDVVISSSSVFIKAIRVPKGTLHINYCHTPARFLWSESESYVKEEVPAALRPFAKSLLSLMRKWDFDASQRVDYFIANSENIRAKISKYYKRESVVIYPPVDTDYFHPVLAKENFYLLAGRLQAHKRSDIVIEAFNLNGKELHVIGTGRAEQSLQKAAKRNIKFYGRVEDQVLREQFSAAKALVFPQEEDFGILAVEAMACGTPVIAYGKGGALETIADHKTGILFEQQTPQGLNQAIEEFEKTEFLSENLFEQSDLFSTSKFEGKIQDFVEKKYENRH